jgi:hypothetical protein
MFDDDLDHRCGDGSGDGCFLDSGAIVHATELCDGNCETVPYSSLRPVPACIRAEGVVSRRDGWVYAVAVVPEVDLRRLKVGYTESPIHQRMAAYRTANPTAILLGLWEGDRFDERRSHAALGGRIGRSEVFQVADLRSALSKLDAALAQYVTGSEV